MCYGIGTRLVGFRWHEFGCLTKMRVLLLSSSIFTKVHSWAQFNEFWLFSVNSGLLHIMTSYYLK